MFPVKKKLTKLTNKNQDMKNYHHCCSTLIFDELLPPLSPPTDIHVTPSVYMPIQYCLLMKYFQGTVYGIRWGRARVGLYTLHQFPAEETVSLHLV